MKYLLIVLIFVYSCKESSINLSGLDLWGDSKELDSLLQTTKAGNVLTLRKNYIVTHTNILLKNITIDGNGFVLKREDQKTYTLKEPSTDHYFILDNTEGIEAVDRVLLCPTAVTNNIPVNTVERKSGDTIFTNIAQPHYPAGTKLYKNILFFWVLTEGKYTDQSCTFKNVTFDGNRDNNKGTVSWQSNSAVIAVSSGLTTYSNCKFINSPGESIVGHNAQIDHCTFLNLNGSGFHASQDKASIAENTIHSSITNSLFKNTNEVPANITGHSEGAITHSNSGGYYTATNCRFENVGESVLGALYPSSTEHDWGTNNIIFKNNKINGAGRIVYLIDTVIAGSFHDVNIEYYTTDSIGVQDVSRELKLRPGIAINRL
jgi:hypothetical protein